MLNPYASYAGNRDPKTILRETAAQLAALAKKIGPPRPQPQARPQ